jgi:hypothetical protein
VSGFCPDPCPENAESRVRNPDTNLVREPLSKPVKEEEDAQAREAILIGFRRTADSAGLRCQRRPARLVAGLAAPAARSRWIDDLGLTEADHRGRPRPAPDHPEPPDGPKALDRFMERAAQRDAQMPSRTAKRRKPKAAQARRPSAQSDHDLAAFYAKMVNADGYLPVSAISNTHARCHAGPGPRHARTPARAGVR